MQKELKKIAFKLLDNTEITIDGSHVVELEISDIHIERSLYSGNNVNLDSYADHFYVVVGPGANYSYPNGREMFETLMYQSGIDEVSLYLGSPDGTITETYIVPQDCCASNNVYANDHQKCVMDNQDNLYIAVDPTWTQDYLEEQVDHG